MDVVKGAEIAKTAIDIVGNRENLNKVAGAMGMLFPFAGVKQKAVEVYIDEIEKSDLPTETKVFLLLNIRKSFKKIKNQKSIAEIAMNNSKDETDFSEKSGVSEEWLDRFMDAASFVSSEEIQVIWGKILANEFRTPGSTPPNMIRILSEITPDLAKAFRYICSMSLWMLPLKEDGDIENSFRRIVVPFSNNEKTFRKMGIGFDILNELETLGVIKFDSAVGYITQGVKNKKILICVGNKLEVIEEHQGDSIPIGDVLLTSVGKSLSSITESVEIDGYYEMINDYLGVKGIKFAEGHDFVARTEGGTLQIERKIHDNIPETKL